MNAEASKTEAQRTLRSILWPVQVVLPATLLVATTLGYSLYRALRHLAPPASDALDVIRATVIVAGFFGAVCAGVYAYRKQRVAEGDAHRAESEQLASRYANAAEQLGHEKASVRPAGVYAMARLADDWEEQRATCIDVLCAYLRMPCDPHPHREGEREVRHTVIPIIRDHL